MLLYLNHSVNCLKLLFLRMFYRICQIKVCHICFGYYLSAYAFGMSNQGNVLIQDEIIFTEVNIHYEYLLKSDIVSNFNVEFNKY